MSALLGLLACFPSGAPRAAPLAAPAPRAAELDSGLAAHERLELRVLQDPERIQVRVRVEPGQPAVLLVGDPWRGRDGFDPVRSTRRVLKPQDEQRAEGWELPIDPAALREGVLELEVAGAGFDERPIAVQAFGLGRRAIDAPLWSSPAFVIERVGGALRVRSFRAHALERDGARALLVLAALALAAGAYAYARRARRASPSPSTSSGGAARLAFGAALALALGTAGWRAAAAGNLADAIYAGRPPPLVWPSDWPLRGERSPRVLGEPFADLCAAIERELRPGETLTVHYSGAGAAGSGILRFAHLAALFPGTRVLLRSHQPFAPGLHACVDFEPPAPHLHSGASGTLIRVEPAHEEAR